MQQQIQFPATVTDYADHWGVTRQTVHAWLRAGKLRSVKIGRLRRILDKHHAHFVRQLERQGGRK